MCNQSELGQGYRSLSIDIKLLYYFLSNTDKIPIRQKDILSHFEGLHPTTIRHHLYSLKDRGIITEIIDREVSYSIKYNDALSVMANFDALMRVVLGDAVYTMYSSYLRET